MVKESHLKPPSRGLARTVYTAENFKLHILFLQACKNSKAFGSNWQIVFRLVPKQESLLNRDLPGQQQNEKVLISSFLWHPHSKLIHFARFYVKVL